jgi:hypothetical protein
MDAETERTAAGLAMTADILAAVAPFVDGQPTDLVIEAFGAAMIATLVAGGATNVDRKTILRRFADRIVGFAAAI